MSLGHFGASGPANSPDSHAGFFHVLQSGVSLEHVSALLGHKNIKVTQAAYSAFTPGRREALEEAVRSTWKKWKKSK